MNPILEKWLAERQVEEKKEREAFLIKQGLVNPSKTQVAYKDITGVFITEEEAKKRREQGFRVEECATYQALDLTDEEYNLVLTHARSNQVDGEPTEYELLKKISQNTGIVSTILIVYVILSIIIGIIIGVKIA